MLSLIIPAHNEETVIARCLRALMAGAAERAQGRYLLLLNPDTGGPSGSGGMSGTTWN